MNSDNMTINYSISLYHTEQLKANGTFKVLRVTLHERQQQIPCTGNFIEPCK